MKNNKTVLNLLILFLCLVIALVIYLFTLRNPTIFIYCQNEVATKIYNYEQSVKKNGDFISSKDESYILSLKKPMLEKCLRDEGFN